MYSTGMNRDDFEQLVSEALDNLPEKFGKKLNNVSVVVEEWPTRTDLYAAGIHHGTLFGLYQGIPQTKRTQYAGVLPDKISIFAGPMLMLYGNDVEAIRNQVKKTVLHEVGHHFGMSEEEIQKAQQN